MKSIIETAGIDSWAVEGSINNFLERVKNTSEFMRVCDIKLKAGEDIPKDMIIDRFRETTDYLLIAGGLLKMMIAKDKNIDLDWIVPYSLLFKKSVEIIDGEVIFYTSSEDQASSIKCITSFLDRLEIKYSFQEK